MQKEKWQEGIYDHQYPKPPISVKAEMGGFLLVEAQPESPETQDKSCGHAILRDYER